MTAKAPRLYVTVRMDPELAERIDAECKLRLISRTYLFEKVLGEWLDEHEGGQ